MRTEDQQPTPPVFPGEILPEPVGEHRARWRNVDDVGSAILLAQPVVDGRNVEKDQPTLASHVGRFQQRFGREIGENE